ncbi:MAG: hypothetical protein ACTSRK_12680 [Promethearchaeota archaeon]
MGLKNFWLDELGARLKSTKSNTGIIPKTSAGKTKNFFFCRKLNLITDKIPETWDRKETLYDSDENRINFRDLSASLSAMRL